ncbi:MAG: 30S ribosomal protein S20 [Oscillospiraceae bacterium]|nr:30S ribosomal protein S20 [Oscillospiraceae bacterium]
MPNIKSQKKRVITAAKENAANKSVRSSLKTELKKVNAEIEAGSADKDALARAASAIDVAARKGAISKNAANRKKAQIASKASK